MTSEEQQRNNADHGDTVPGDSESKLINLDVTNSVNSGKDINNKITSLDTDLEKLRAELALINESVDEGLDRLGDTDTDLTAKVSETYKRLGEIDNAYKALIEISTRIDLDIQKLDGDVSTVAVQSAEGLKSLEQTSIAQSNEFTQRNQIVVSEVNKLVETSRLTSEIFTQKIQLATNSMAHIEQHVIAEIERLADTTNNKTDVIQGSIESNKAKIIKLQSVDEAIIRRATTLEISSAELTVKSQNIESSINQLEGSANDLAADLHVLKDRTDSLEALTAKHETLIGGLHKASSDIADKVIALTGHEKRHFNIVTMGFLLLLLVTAVIYFTQQNQFSISETKTAARSDKVDNQVANIQQMQASTSVVTNSSLAALETKVEALNTALQNEIKPKIALVDSKVETINDQVKSVEGRFNQSTPFSEIGDDNVIHGEAWIAEMPRDNFVVQLAYADNKDVLYEVAQSYNSYLKDSLSYFQVDNNSGIKHVLLSGNYRTEKSAREAIASMPRYIDMQRPVVRKIESIQKYLAE